MKAKYKPGAVIYSTPLSADDTAFAVYLREFLEDWIHPASIGPAEVARLLRTEALRIEQGQGKASKPHTKAPSCPQNPGKVVG